jgi:hypothetical protein
MNDAPSLIAAAAANCVGVDTPLIEFSTSLRIGAMNTSSATT